VICIATQAKLTSVIFFFSEVIMPAGIYNFAAEQGATLQRVITYTDPDEVVINLTSYTALMQVRTTAASGTVILELSTAAGITINGAAGTLTLLVDATTMSGLTPASYVYDLEITSPGSIVTRLIEGKFVVKAEVTR